MISYVFLIKKTIKHWLMSNIVLILKNNWGSKFPLFFCSIYDTYLGWPHWQTSSPENYLITEMQDYLNSSSKLLQVTLIELSLVFNISLSLRASNLSLFSITEMALRNFMIILRWYKNCWNHLNETVLFFSYLQTEA